MKIQSQRFGALEVLSGDIFLFPKGISGFSDQYKSFVLIDDPQNDLFLWLQSTENSEMAFCLLEAELLDYSTEIKLSEKENKVLKIQKENLSFQTFYTITLLEDLQSITANIKCPILLNTYKHIGHQVILPDTNLSFNEPIFSQLKTRLTPYQREQIKSSLPNNPTNITPPLQ